MPCARELLNLKSRKMSTIAEMTRKVSKLNLSVQVPRIIRATAPAIVKTQQEQMYMGKNAKGVNIFPGDRAPGVVYAPFTIFVKTHERHPPQPIDRVTLRDTGTFYKGIQVKNITREKFEITSKNKKTQELEDRYGEAIFGLNPDSRAVYISDYFLPELKQYIESTASLLLK